MNVTFVGQPFADEPNLHEVLEHAIQRESAEQLTIAVAWAKRSGLRRLESMLRSFAASGGTSRLILGIDEGGATVEGLVMASDLFDDVFVVHDPSGRTFHPKVYVVRGSGWAIIFIGSNNTTAGGVFFNYEAGVCLDLDLSVNDDSALLGEVESYLNRLVDDDGVCLPMTESVLAELIENPTYGVTAEGSSHGTKPSGDAPEDSDSQVTEAEPLFSSSKEPKRSGPPLDTTKEDSVAPIPAGTGTPGYAALRWSKRLPASDAQRPPQVDTNPTGNVRLTKAGHPIDWTSFFRNKLFGDATWTPETTSDKETTTIDFRVTILGQDRGKYPLMISHVPHRESGQANHTTVLHWDALSIVLAEQDFTDHYLTLELLSNGEYHLSLSDVPPDPPYIGPSTA